MHGAVAGMMDVFLDFRWSLPSNDLAVYAAAVLRVNCANFALGDVVRTKASVIYSFGRDAGYHTTVLDRAG